LVEIKENLLEYESAKKIVRELINELEGIYPINDLKDKMRQLRNFFPD